MESIEPDTVKSLMALWPSFSDLARDVGEGYETVRGWAKRGSIPVGYWPRLIDSAAPRGVPGVTADLLMWLHAPANDAAPTGARSSEDAA